MAPELKERLGVPIVCGLAGEDLFLEQLKEPHYGQSRQLLRELAHAIDRFVAYNAYFADFMADYLSVDRRRIQVIRHGLELDGHTPRQPTPAGQPLTIGYFGRIAPEKGIHLLIEAFAQLAADASLPPLRFKIAGYKSPGDEPYFESVIQRTRELNLADRFEYAGELDRLGKLAFLQSLDIMAVATIYHESKGLSVIEALASGVPVVAPRHGSFPEIIAQTSGGLLCEPENPADLAAKLREYILAPELCAEHGRRGRQAIHASYAASQMARQHVDLYRHILQGAASTQPIAEAT